MAADRMIRGIMTIMSDLHAVPTSEELYNGF